MRPARTKLARKRQIARQRTKARHAYHHHSGCVVCDDMVGRSVLSELGGRAIVEGEFVQGPLGNWWGATYLNGELDWAPAECPGFVKL